MKSETCLSALSCSETLEERELHGQVYILTLFIPKSKTLELDNQQFTALWGTRVQSPAVTSGYYNYLYFSFRNLMSLSGLYLSPIHVVHTHTQTYVYA